MTTTPIPEQSSGPLFYAEKIIPKRMPAQVDLIILGDSQAANWPEDLAKSLDPAGNVFNLGVAGDRTQNVLWRLREPALKRLDPSNVILFIGRNNINANDKPCAVAIGTMAIVKMTHLVWPKTHIVVVGVTPLRIMTPQRTSDLLDLKLATVSLLGQTKLANYVDVSSAVACAGPSCEALRPDGMHYTQVGYEGIGHLVAPLLLSHH
ncbi:hypothetical protein ACELLULO517_06440 [Acidisoma cellulosilytica]|uniref:SGNH hydrolase-type esterase domain-containing protein n=1 Tax=Acidisoma cellulosilyticum TaxID=2802395 RepID=A0A963YZD8_9PROT|nr:GDSL-type esterase/lipase family protein [Acidisoma cellulosilyticum]MCB8879865.1 hypothetical protein [Acidisoma cellulosilyticum]